MSKKKHPEHVNHERWLVSYADFITLLFAFFVVLFASGQSDNKKQRDLSLAMQTAFAQMGLFEPRSKTPSLSDAAGSSGSGSPSPLGSPLPTEEAPAVKAEEKKIKEALAKPAGGHPLPPGSFVLHATAEGLVISLREAGFFASGSSELRSESMPTLLELATVLPDGIVRVEGHTDNVPIHTAQFPSNWELSSARAAAIARVILQYGPVKPTEMAAEGFAEFHPFASNDTEAGRAQNRRVDVIVLRRAPTAAAPVAASVAVEKGATGNGGKPSAAGVAVMPGLKELPKP